MTRAMKARSTSRSCSLLGAGWHRQLLLSIGFLAMSSFARTDAVVGTQCDATTCTRKPPWKRSLPDFRAACPNVISREEWGAREPKSWEYLTVSPVAYVVIHHGGIARYCENQTTCSKIVRSYQDLHMDDNGWADIGYNFVVGEDGNVYMGRGWDRVGAHAPGYNTQSIGICVMGDFSARMPNAVALEALNCLIDWGLNNQKISPNYNIIGHRQTRKTECPGERFYRYVMKMPRWTNRPVPIFSSNSSSTLL